MQQEAHHNSSLASQRKRPKLPRSNDSRPGACKQHITTQFWWPTTTFHDKLDPTLPETSKTWWRPTASSTSDRIPYAGSLARFSRREAPDGVLHSASWSDFSCTSWRDIYRSSRTAFAALALAARSSEARKARSATKKCVKSKYDFSLWIDYVKGNSVLLIVKMHVSVLETSIHDMHLERKRLNFMWLPAIWRAVCTKK